MGTAMTAAVGAGVALFFTFKLVYENYIRKDVQVTDAPVLSRLTYPVHASHRGGAKLYPENTMLALRNAVTYVDDKGVKRQTQMLEFDIQKTKDNHLVIMHNLDVNATTDGCGLVSAMTLDEIRGLDAGYWFTLDSGLSYPFRGQGHQVPTLVEVLTEFTAVDNLVFYLDFKTADAVADTLKIVESFQLMDRIILGAIPPAANTEIQRLKPPGVPTSPDVSSMIWMYIFHMCGLLWLVPMRFEIVGTTAHRFGYKVLNKRLVKAFHARKRLMAVFGDHLDTADGQLECLKFGCDLLVSDRPDILHASLEEWRELNLSAMGGEKLIRSS